MVEKIAAYLAEKGVKKQGGQLSSPYAVGRGLAGDAAPLRSSGSRDTFYGYEELSYIEKTAKPGSFSVRMNLIK